MIGHWDAMVIGSWETTVISSWSLGGNGLFALLVLSPKFLCLKMVSENISFCSFAFRSFSKICLLSVVLKCFSFQTTL